MSICITDDLKYFIDIQVFLSQVSTIYQSLLTVSFEPFLSSMVDSTMSNPASWRPIEEFPGQLFAERTWLEGAILLGVVYGAELVIFLMCLNLLVRQITRKNWKIQVPLVIYIWILFICSTIFIAANSNMARLSFVDNRNFPGGPSAFETVMFSIPVDNMGNVAFVIANWLADGLMVNIVYLS